MSSTRTDEVAAPERRATVLDDGPTSGGQAPRRSAGRAAARPPGSFGAIGYAYAAPAFLVYATVVLTPIVATFWLSLHEWDGLTERRYVGFDNYVQIFEDERLRSTFTHAFVLIFFYCVIPVVVGLLLVSLMSRHTIRGFRFFRTVLFLPAVMTPAVVAVTWRWIYAPEGVLNAGLDRLGLDRFARPWLGDFDIALYAVGFIGTWVYIGLAMVLFLAGMQRLPVDMYEAARIDGATLFEEIRFITIPSLRNEIVIVVTLTMIGALRTFDLIYLTTKGGPGNQTDVPSLEIFKRAFLQGKIGSAAALAMLLALLVLVLSLIIPRVGRQRP
jgi:raffinose/stachyose/melibiose transport system permease protein